jgi:hypothetical protein
MRWALRCDSLIVMSTNTTHPSPVELSAELIEVTGGGLHVAEVGVVILLGLLACPPLLILALVVAVAFIAVSALVAAVVAAIAAHAAVALDPGRPLRRRRGPRRLPAAHRVVGLDLHDLDGQLVRPGVAGGARGAHRRDAREPAHGRRAASVSAAKRETPGSDDEEQSGVPAGTPSGMDVAAARYCPSWAARGQQHLQLLGSIKPKTRM